MSKIAKGEVAVTLDGTEYTLKPSLNAFSQLGSRYDNHGALLGKVGCGNVPAIVMVLRLGLGWGDKDAKKLPDLVFKTGIPSLIDPVTDYVWRLFNAGKSFEESIAEKDAAEAEAGDAEKGKPEETENPLLGA
ncbi:hypothetical protein [Arenibaculum pallidiluteum]|uniref:hypothetical protein n=1 Tax=Arenibaculum pallidiluteum TaxID=2812559 RepID=UPI001A97C7F8|nr:hypothetical protein [Arenibaculum pallidiluteum]